VGLHQPGGLAAIQSSHCGCGCNAARQICEWLTASEQMAPNQDRQQPGLSPDPCGRRSNPPSPPNHTHPAACRSRRRPTTRRRPSLRRWPSTLLPTLTQRTSASRTPRRQR
jgi:hypothetical protein